MAKTTETSNSYLLIDFENVHDLDFPSAGDPNLNIYIFLGEHTRKLPVEDVQRLLKHGNVEIVQMSGQGKNALDFHIAYYVGRIAATDPTATLRVISRDTGFDPLLKHLTSTGVRIDRSSTLPGKAVSKKAPSPTKVDPLLERAVLHLSKIQASLPSKRKSLQSSLCAAFRAELDPAKTDRLIEALVKHGTLSIDDKGAVAYRIPAKVETA